MITTFLRQLSKSCNGWQKAHLCGKFVYSSTWKRFQNGWEWSTCFHGAFSLWCRQWCSQNRNLRDRDLVKTSRPRLHQISETETRDFQICAFCRKFSKNVVITCMFYFFQISVIFPTCFGCFLPANTTNKKSLNYKNFTLPVLCNIQSFKTCSLRDRDETWNLLDQWFVTFFTLPFYQTRLPDLPPIHSMFKKDWLELVSAHEPVTSQNTFENIFVHIALWRIFSLWQKF